MIWGPNGRIIDGSQHNNRKGTEMICQTHTHRNMLCLFQSSNGMRNLCKKPCSAMVVFLGMPFPAEYNSAESYVKVRL